MRRRRLVRLCETTSSRALHTLPPQGAPEGFLNLGLNGSYMVVRELRQYVARFWQSLEDNAARIRAHDPSATHVTADWLAERIVGRNIDGHLLCPSGIARGRRTQNSRKTPSASPNSIPTATVARSGPTCAVQILATASRETLPRLPPCSIR